MLIIAHKLSNLDFSKLMQVYQEGNIENGADRYPHLSAVRQEAAAEQDFYQYLNEVFFLQEHSFYAVWENEGAYVSALRIEPYRDGFLLCALETAPGLRCRGYASLLIENVICYLSKQGDGVLYSHISKKNMASLAVHRKFGFSVTDAHAVYSDGSVSNHSYTLKLCYKESESN